MCTVKKTFNHFVSCHGMGWCCEMVCLTGKQFLVREQGRCRPRGGGESGLSPRSGKISVGTPLALRKLVGGA